MERSYKELFAMNGFQPLYKKLSSYVLNNSESPVFYLYVDYVLSIQS